MGAREGGGGREGGRKGGRGKDRSVARRTREELGAWYQHIT